MNGPSPLTLLTFSVCETIFQDIPSLKPNICCFQVAQELEQPASDPDFLPSEAVITTKARVNVCRDAIFIILKRVAFLVGHSLLLCCAVCSALAQLCLLGSQLPTYIFTTNKMQVHIRMTLTTKRCCIQFVCQNTVLYFYLIVWKELFFQIVRGS